MFSAVKRSLANKPGAAEIRSNIIAGLTVGIIALPLSMALAIAVNVPPQHGLYTAMFAGIFIALSGGSKVNISGPTAAFVVVLLPIVQQWGIGGLLVSGLIAGLILILLGIGKLGKLIEIVPYPVVVGFTAGIAVVIATFQIKDFLGLQIASLDGHFPEKLLTIVQSLPTLQWTETFIGALTLFVLIIWPRIHSKIPGHLIALLLGTFTAWGLGVLYPEYTIATIGSRFHYEIGSIIGNGIPPVMPSFDWPWNLPDASGEPIGISFELVRVLLPSAITIAILGALESLLCATVADGMSGKKHNPNDELIGQGIGNVIAPLFGGIPATAAIARTAASVKAGGTMPLAAIIHGLFILAAILVLAPLLAYIPMASMAALLIMVAWNMSEAKHFVRTLKIAPGNDVVVLVLCFLLTVLIDMTVAVAVGLGLAALLFIHKSISLTNTTRMEKNLEKYGDVADEIVIYDINGPLFFGSAQKALNAISMVTPNLKVIILDMTEVNMIDMSAIVAMEAISNSLKNRNVCLIINSLEARMVLKLRRAGIRYKPEKIMFSRKLEDAIAMAKKCSLTSYSAPAE